MAKVTSAGSTAASAPAAVKMIKVHSQYQEADVEAAQTDSDENRFTGTNPYPAGTARAQGWDYLKKMSK